MSAPPQDESDAPPVINWVAGLPDVVIPLTQPLFPPEIASSFFISPVPRRSYSDVTRAAEETISLMRGLEMTAVSESGFNRTVYDEKSGQERIENVVDDDESGDEGEGEREGEGDNLGNKAVKRPRLVWTPRLHTRFMEVVEHLGIKNAVPKTIMQLMNVEGLTRENVASHMQKYRLYLKRMNGGLGEASGSQELCSESNASGNVGNEGTGRNPMVNYGVVPGHGMVPVPLPGYGVPDCLMGGNSSGLGGCGGFDYGMVTGREWNGDINGPVRSFNQIAPNEDKRFP